MRPTATILQGSSQCGYWLRSNFFLFAWTDALPGRVAALNLALSNSGSTGANKIILPGETILTGDNEALVVVDGVVINQDSGRRRATGGEVGYGTGSDNMPAGYGSGSSDSKSKAI